MRPDPYQGTTSVVPTITAGIRALAPALQAEARPLGIHIALVEIAPADVLLRGV
jgi:hypothetical protein